LSTTIALNNLSPIERLTAIDIVMSQKNNPLLTLSEIALDNVFLHKKPNLNDTSYHLILTCLAALGSAFSSTIKFDNFLYILDDRSVYMACQYHGDTFDMSYEIFLKKLDVLSLAGLIYRFNVAMKFGYPAQSVFQLRLNSWGRELVQQEKLFNRSEFKKINDIVINYIKDRIDIYNKITAICDSPAVMIDVAQLHSLNSTLEIKVVT
jgi:hypothetical protein